MPRRRETSLQVIGRLLELTDRLAQIDDVNLVALLEDERLHLRVPTLGLMAKVNAGFQQFGHQFGWLSIAHKVAFSRRPSNPREAM